MRRADGNTPAHHRTIAFRPSIAGLRALAVMAVVLFHFGATWLPGGFVGVDVFFVISGFLISKSIFRDIENGSFSLIDFYERRARRIVPALFVVTAATAAGGAIVLFPGQLVAFARSAIAAATFTSNLYFYASTDYFSPAAIETPLLHYWSLGVEEQFYVVFPLLIMAVRRLTPGMIAAVLGLLLVASLVACEAMLRFDPAAAFYLLPFRAFELLIGSLLAVRIMRFPRSRIVATTAAGGGLALLLASFLFIDETFRFPGLVALLPCLATALVIWGSERVASWPSRLLGTRPMAFVGAISYSLYLVHWPIVVFWKMVQPDVDPLVFLGVGTLASIALAWASYRLVEQPIRLRQAIVMRKTVFALSGGALAVLVAAAVPVIGSGGFPGRQDAEVKRILDANNGDWRYLFRAGTCFLDPDQGARDLDSTACLAGGHPDVLLWGSSFIAQFYRGLEPLLAERGLTLGQITASSCAPHVGIEVYMRPNCRPLNDFVASRIAEMRPKLVIIGGDALISDDDFAGLDRSIDALAKTGVRIVVLGPMVMYRQRVPDLLAQRVLDGNRSILSDDDVIVQSADVIERAKAHYSNDKRVTFILPKTDLCTDEGCVLMDGRDVLYFDVVHFSQEGSLFYSRRLMNLMDSILKTVR